MTLNRSHYSAALPVPLIGLRSIDAKNSEDFISSLTLAERLQLLQNCHKRYYQKDDLIFRLGDPASGLLILLTGAVKITSFSQEGDTRIFKIAGAVDVLSTQGLEPKACYDREAHTLCESELVHSGTNNERVRD